jgi:hypothetical protein
VSDCKYLNIKNLKFEGAGRNAGNASNGIAFSFCSNIVLDSVEVLGFQHSGLTAKDLGENYRISNVYAHDNGFAGIFIAGINKTSLSDIYIGYCNADNNPGDPTVTNNHSGSGILAYNAKKITIEYCKASNNGGEMPWNQNGPGGIWVVEVDSVVIQHCISHDNKTPVGAQDGVGFDLDGGTTNSIIQYCLSYNNHGAGYGIFQYSGASDWKNNIIRYCVSENDGNVSGDGSVIVWNGSGINNEFQGLEFYNNVIYNANGPAIDFLDHANSNLNFRNNIFVSESGKIYDGIEGENFQGNCWYSLNNSYYQDSVNFMTWAQTNTREMLNGEIVGMFANPMLVNPGNSTLTDPTILPSVDDYKIVESSPLVDAGLDLESLFNINPGNQDYFGNPLNSGQAFDIGIYQNIDKQEIGLLSGWNIMSFGVMPNDSNLKNILQPLIDNETLKKVMDEEGNTIEDWGVYGGWKNAIGNIKSTEGYKINVNLPATLTTAGVRIQIPINITLIAGWNIISWPLASEQSGMAVFQSLIDSGKLKKVMDETGNTIEDWGVFGGWKNNIGNFMPGEGYKVNVTGDCILNICESNTKSQRIIPEKTATSHFIPAFKGNGINHMNINLVNLKESGIIDGDEIGIFDGNICVGSAKFSTQDSEFGIQKSLLSIPVSASDNSDGKNGYSDGNTITFKLFRKGNEYPLNLEPINNVKTVFEKGGSLFAEVNLTTRAEIFSEDEQAEIKCYPNPFSDAVTIELYLKTDTKVEIEVMNNMGQRVKLIVLKQQIPGGKHLFTWDGRNDGNQRVSNGVYHLKINLGETIIKKKIVYLN